MYIIYVRTHINTAPPHPRTHMHGGLFTTYHLLYVCTQTHTHKNTHTHTDVWRFAQKPITRVPTKTHRQLSGVHRKHIFKHIQRERERRTHTHTHARTHTHTHTHATCVWAYTCVCVCVCVCVYMYIRTNTSRYSILTPM